jgi:iron(III) transport system substrate-binding protein
MKRIGWGFLGVLVALALAAGSFPSVAQAADPPALRGLSGAERERVAKLIEGARKEGGLMYLTHSMNPEIFQDVSKVFKEYYGLPNLNMQHALMRSSKLVARASKEIRAGRHVNDVIHVAAPLFYDKLIEMGELARYTSPEYKHYDPEVTSGTGAAAAKPGYYISSMVFYYGIIYNTKFVKSWRKILPLSYWEKLSKQDPSIILASRTIVNRVVAGEYWIGIFPSMRLLYKEWKRGVTHVKALYPGNRAVPIGVQVGILEKAPHPNAARLWVDFFHSEKGQSLLVGEMGHACARKDVEVPALLRPISPPVSEMNLIRIDWSTFGPEDKAKIKAEFRGIFVSK